MIFIEIIATLMFIYGCFGLANQAAKDRSINSINIPMGLVISGIGGIVYLIVLIYKLCSTLLIKYFKYIVLIIISFLPNAGYSQEISISDKFKDRDKIHTVLDTMPTVPGGWASLVKYLDTTIKVSKPTNETVITSIIIDNGGYITDVGLIKGLSDDSIGNLNIVSALKTMPQWAPGIKNGEAVKTMIFYPIQLKTKE